MLLLFDFWHNRLILTSLSLKYFLTNIFEKEINLNLTNKCLNNNNNLIKKERAIIISYFCLNSINT